MSGAPRRPGAAVWLLACLGLPAAGSIVFILVGIVLEVAFAPTSLHLPVALLIALAVAVAAYRVLAGRGAGTAAALLGAAIAIVSTGIALVISITALFLAACGSNCFD